MSRLYSWDELTEAEKAEALERGFPRGNVKYRVKSNYRDGDWKLERWERK